MDAESALNLKSEHSDKVIPRKKMKLDDNLSCQSVDDFNVIPVLADEYTADPVMKLVYIADITDKRETSKIVKNLQNVYPLNDLQHLKRVKLNEDVLQVIICTVEDFKIQNEDLEETLPIKTLLGDNNFDTKGLSENVVLRQVPFSVPLTRRQYDFGSKFWPQQFHENKHISKILNGTLFSTQEKLTHCKFMRIALKMAKIASKKNELPVGAVIVDTKNNKVVGLGYDRRKIHPLQHAVMIAIDRVAQLQGGGVWNFEDQDLTVEKPDICTNTDPKSSPYLCTNYDLYVTREPCTMCAMALTHSRIKRVFFSVDSKHGALGTISKIHVQPGLNHHYEVFKRLLHEECSAMMSLNVNVL